MKVFLSYSLDADLSEELPPAIKSISLWRRMTPLQKAVLLGLTKVSLDRPDLLERFKAEEASIYFTSAYGEISSMLSVTDSIAELSLPVSPKDFQHSVLNAAVAYFAMQIHSHQAAFAVSGSFESPDLALMLAAKRLDAGFDKAALIIHAEEFVRGAGEHARAEFLFLDSERLDSAQARLKRIEQGHQALSMHGDTGEGEYTEGAERTTAWFLHDRLPAAKRSLRTVAGAVFRSDWEIFS